MRAKRKMNLLFAALLLCVATFTTSTFVSLADSYDDDNTGTFSNIVLPNLSSNTTLSSGTKTTNLSYGKVKFSKISYCSEGVNCWMRSYDSGNWHYWLPYLVNVNDTSQHKINYCDDSSSYYSTGTNVQLRAENAEERIAIVNNSVVSGKVWFN